VSEQLLTILKLCLLALLYLFFIRVLRAVWAEMRVPAPAPAGAAGATRAGSRSAGGQAPARGRRSRGRPTELVAAAPQERRGTTYPIGAEATIGRAGGCVVSLPEDTFVSNVHARVFTSGDRVLVEDLGSTNGTYLNQARVTAPVAAKRGDQLRIGNTVLELR
jgi:pSer/pThr/pTyr-binding forkhead associated (FHA) protein